jgi:hypothetical protein
LVSVHHSTNEMTNAKQTGEWSTPWSPPPLPLHQQLSIRFSQSNSTSWCYHCDRLDYRYIRHHLHYWPFNTLLHQCCYYLTCGACLDERNNDDDTDYDENYGPIKRKAFANHPMIPIYKCTKRYRWPVICLLPLIIITVSFFLRSLQLSNNSSTNDDDADDLHQTMIAWRSSMIVVMGVWSLCFIMLIRGSSLLHRYSEYRDGNARKTSHQYHSPHNEYLSFMIALHHHRHHTADDDHAISGSPFTILVKDRLYDHTNFVRMIGSFVDHRIAEHPRITTIRP